MSPRSTSVGRRSLRCRADSFIVQVDGKAVSVATADTAPSQALPLSLVLAIDTSGSMAGASLEAARAATTSIVSALEPTDHVSLISFASAVVGPSSFTADRAAVTDAIAKLAANGNTALYAAAQTAAQTASNAPDQRRAVVLLSDGEEFGGASGSVTRDAALSAAAGAGVPFYVVGLGAEVDRPFLASLAAETGGTYLGAANAGELAQLYQRISDRLRLQYSLHFAVPMGLAGGVHRVRVAVGDASAETTFTVSVPVTKPTIVGLDGPLSAPTVVTVAGVDVAGVRFDLDGTGLAPLADGRSVRLDPFDLDPTVSHRLGASWFADGKTGTASADVNVATLPPELLAPMELPGLLPGDLVRVTVRAQPGTNPTVRYVVDGGEGAEVQGPPFAFTLPTGVAAGDHSLSLLVGTGESSMTRSFGFTVAARDAGSPLFAYVLIGIAVVAGVATVLAAIWMLARRIARLRQRRMEEGPHVDPKGAVVPRPTTDEPWGALTVVRGGPPGATFALRQARELIGSGRFCSVRIRQSGVKDAHAVIDRDGNLQASAPTCAVNVDGEPVREARLADGAELALGDVVLRFERRAPMSANAALEEAAAGP